MRVNADPTVFPCHTLHKQGSGIAVTPHHQVLRFTTLQYCASSAMFKRENNATLEQAGVVYCG